MAAVTSLNKHKIVFGENEKNAKNIGSNLVERCQCLFLIRVCFLGMHDTLKKDSNVENLITFRKSTCSITAATFPGNRQRSKILGKSE